MIGKLAFNCWNQGPYKFMHIGSLQVEDLCREPNIFTLNTHDIDNEESAFLEEDVLAQEA